MVNTTSCLQITQVPNVDMVEVESGDVLQMREEKFAAILDDINAKMHAVRLATILPTTLSIVALVAGLVVSVACVWLLVITLPLWLVGKWIDAGRRVTVLLYELDERSEKAFARLTEAFDLMMSCSSKWHIEAGGAVRDLTTWKQNAGASHLVQKSPTSLNYSLPSIIVSNVTPPALQVGRQIYLLPTGRGADPRRPNIRRGQLRRLESVLANIEFHRARLAAR